MGRWLVRVGSTHLSATTNETLVHRKRNGVDTCRQALEHAQALACDGVPDKDGRCSPPIFLRAQLTRRQIRPTRRHRQCRNRAVVAPQQLLVVRILQILHHQQTPNRLGKHLRPTSSRVGNHDAIAAELARIPQNVFQLQGTAPVVGILVPRLLSL